MPACLLPVCLFLCLSLSLFISKVHKGKFHDGRGGGGGDMAGRL
jgi:hypothetical protein